MPESQEKKPEDPNWWHPWAVLVGLVVFGLLGFLGVFSPKRGGPTAADVPTEIASAQPPAKK